MMHVLLRADDPRVTITLHLCRARKAFIVRVIICLNIRLSVIASLETFQFLNFNDRDYHLAHPADAVR